MKRMLTCWCEINICRLAITLLNRKINCYKLKSLDLYCEWQYCIIQGSKRLQIILLRKALRKWCFQIPYLRRPLSITDMLFSYSLVSPLVGLAFTKYLKTSIYLRSFHLCRTFMVSLHRIKNTLYYYALYLVMHTHPRSSCVSPSQAVRSTCGSSKFYVLCMHFVRCY